MEPSPICDKLSTPCSGSRMVSNAFKSWSDIGAIPTGILPINGDVVSSERSIINVERRIDLDEVRVD